MYNAPVPMVRVIHSMNVSLLGMVRKAAWNEPKGAGIHWVCDDMYPVCLSGDVALLMYCT